MAVLVKCDMCDDMHDLESWDEGKIFICILCVKLLQRIKNIEIRKKIELPEDTKLRLFDHLRYFCRINENYAKEIIEHE